MALLRKNFKNFSYPKILLFLSLLLFLILWFSLNAGYVNISIWDALSTLLGFSSNQKALMVLNFRLPRIIIAALIGMGLSVSGCIIQGVVKNPLADPNLMGISAGSGFMIILYALFWGTAGFLSVLTLPFLSLLGGCMAVGLIYFLAYKNFGGASPFRLLLTGIGVQAGILALTTLLVVKLDEKQYDLIVSFQTGQIWGTNWSFVLALLPWLCFWLPYAFAKAPILNLLNLGDESAIGLGVSLQRERFLLLFAAVSLAASCVAVGGNIGFIGLIAPHLTRQFVGAKHEILLPACALTGAILVSLADALGRILLQPAAIPTGIMAALLGAPYFIYLLSKTGH